MSDHGAELNGVHAPTRPGSAIGPLREPLFRALWIAAIVSYTGTWMQNLGAGWLMATLTNSPILVGLVQSAIALPVFLVSIVAGAIADMVDRRRLLLLTQTWMVLAALALGLVTEFGVVTPLLLLAFTFMMGLGNTMNDPAWQAITQEIVCEENFPAAVALNSAGFNVARSVGPALGGVIIAIWGVAAAFFLNAVSFFGVILVLFGWKRRPHDGPLPAKNVQTAIKAGFEFARHSGGIKSVLIRTAVFSLSASALWAMLPLVAKRYGSIGFGTMVAAFGVGALAGAAMLPALRRMMSVDAMVAAATVVFAAVGAAAGYITHFHLHCAVMFLGGMGWIIILASLNVSAQFCSPSWLRARVLSMYLLVLQGGLAVGSSFWGAVAEHFSISISLSAASVALIAGLVVSRKFHLGADHVQFRATPVQS